MVDVSIAQLVAVFIAGIAMFLAPCTLPILPAFLASLASRQASTDHKREAYLRMIAFVGGFTLVFFLLGLLTGVFGSTLSAEHRQVFTYAGGVLIIIFGISTMGFIDLSFLKKLIPLSLSARSGGARKTQPFLIGVTFGLTWSPCAGPILASILILASQTSTALEGAALLLVFSLGLAIPFLCAGMLFAHVLGLLRYYEKYQRRISIISGTLLICIGLSMLFMHDFLFTELGIRLYGIFGLSPICSYY